MAVRDCLGNELNAASAEAITDDDTERARRDLARLDAPIRSGNAATVQQILESHCRYDPNGVPLNRMLACVLEKLGLMDEAHEPATRPY